MLGNLHRIVLSLCLAASAGCATTDARIQRAGSQAQLFSNVGSYERPITTDSYEAQAYFDQGLIWMYGFNHDEAIRSFSRAAQLDPQCAMAYWGVALCEGPNYNDPVMTDRALGRRLGGAAAGAGPDRQHDAR